MKKRKILTFNYITLFVGIILSLGGPVNCCLSYGHGLGDLFYFFPLWFLTSVHFILVIFLKKRIRSIIIIPIIFTMFELFLVSNIIFNRGPECTCRFFSKKEHNHHETELIESYYIDTINSNTYTINKHSDSLAF